MKISNRRESTTLFLGDIVIFGLSLWLMLFLRNFKIPTLETYITHLQPFSLIFGVSIITFFIAGLYEKHTVILKSRLPHTIFRAEIINSVLAIVFFYFVPYFGISPKTTLFIYIIVSFLLVVLWRLSLYNLFFSRKVEQAVLISSGKEMSELVDEINRNGNYGLRFTSLIDLEQGTPEDIKARIKEVTLEEGVSIVVIDLEHDKVQAILPSLYKLIFSQVRFVAMYKVYEDVFKRVPFSILQYNWFLENISLSPKIMYDFLKRLIDIVISLIGITIPIILFPFVYLAIKIENKAHLFVIQERIGKGGKKIKIIKFGSMTTNDRGVWVKEKDDRITRVGKFLRKSRIDELPQFWNVLKGDISLIGPRPDIYDLGKELEDKISYYAVRSVITPGLSGWAQISQELPPQSIEETELRLAYDLYYVKNRSFILDMRIILRTIKTLLSRTGM